MQMPQRACSADFVSFYFVFPFDALAKLIVQVASLLFQVCKFIVYNRIFIERINSFILLSFILFQGYLVHLGMNVGL